MYNSLLKFSTGQGTCACISHMEAFGRDCCIRGYHVYKEIWQAVIGEELECDREPDNSCDRYSEESPRQLELLLVHDQSYWYSHSPEPQILHLRRYNIYAQMHTHTRNYVTRRATSISPTNVSSSNYSPWNI